MERPRDPRAGLGKKRGLYQGTGRELEPPAQTYRGLSE